jgi:hypothetical protein
MGSSARSFTFVLSLWPIYTSYRAEQEARHPELEMPSLKSMIPVEANDEDDEDDDDLETAAAPRNMKDPVGLRIMTDPVSKYALFFSTFNKNLKSRISSGKCQHSYENKTIREMIQQNGPGLFGCPVPGCDAKFTAKDLTPNKELKKHIERFLKQEERKGQGTQTQKKKRQIVVEDSEEE